MDVHLFLQNILEQQQQHNLDLAALAALGSIPLIKNKPKHTESTWHNLGGFHSTK